MSWYLRLPSSISVLVLVGLSCFADPQPPPAVKLGPLEPLKPQKYDPTSPGPSEQPTLATTSAARVLATDGPVTSWIEKAENVDEVIVSPSQEYSVVQSQIVAEGVSAFQLVNVNFNDISLTISPTITVSSDTKLYFQSRLGWASPQQTAKAEIVIDGDPTVVWSLPGSSGNESPFPTQDRFELVSIDLSDYVGQIVSVRFSFEFTTGSAYIQPTSGWFIDDIQIGTNYTPNPYIAVGNPTAEEVLLVEYINRARSNANAEALRLRDTDDPDVIAAMSGVDRDIMVEQFADLAQAAQPLAINGMLTAATRLHSQDMLNNAFQGHNSSESPLDPNEPGDGLGDRAERQGFVRVSLGENVFAHAKSIWYAHAGFNVDWGTSASTGRSIGGMQDPPGHRENIHESGHREIGVGVIHGTNANFGPILVTQNMGIRSGFDVPFLVGVTIVDADSDGFYDVGEGLDDVLIEVENSTYYTTSSENGSYALPLPGNGKYAVTFSRSGYSAQTVVFDVVDDTSVKIDFLAEATAAIEEVTILTVSMPNDTTLRLHVSYAGEGSDLAIESSTDLKAWEPASAEITTSDDHKFQIDITRSSDPFYVRVTPEI